MKKLLVIMLLFFAAPVFAAEKMYVIPHINLTFGIGDAYEPSNDYSANPGFGIGGVFGYGVSDAITLEGSISYVYWFTDAPSGSDWTLYQLPIFGGIKYSLSNQLGIIGGVGVAYFNSEVGNVETSDTELAFYAGAHIDYDNIIIRPQFVFINTPDEAQTYIQLSAGYKFNL